MISLRQALPGVLGLAAAAIVMLPFPPAHAGAWTLPKGKKQLISQYSYYSADRYYDNRGQARAQPLYRKIEWNPYFEYGLRDGLTLTASTSLQQASQTSASLHQYSWGVGDSELSLRQKLWQGGNWVVSAEPVVKLPSPAPAGLSPRIGSRHFDAGGGLNLGYGFDAFGLHHFADASLGYRYRFGAPGDQIKAAATAGIGVARAWTLMPQAFATYRRQSPDSAAFTQSSGDDYDLVTLQLSAVYKRNERWAFQAGAFADIQGENTGAGKGALVSIWLNF